MPLPSSTMDIQTQLKALKSAWKAAQAASQAVQDPNYEIAVPDHLLDAILASSSSQETTEAWEAVNYYQKAFIFALQQIEREALQRLKDFASMHGLIRDAQTTRTKVCLS